MFACLAHNTSPTEFPIVTTNIILMKTGKKIPGKQISAYVFFFIDTREGGPQVEQSSTDEVEDHKEEDIWYMQSKCWASQRKSVKYNQKVMISEDVDYAACHGCPI